MTTTLSISRQAKAAGVEMAKRDRRSLSGQIEVLILEEATRRGLTLLPVAKVSRKGAAK